MISKQHKKYLYYTIAMICFLEVYEIKRQKNQLLFDIWWHHKCIWCWCWACHSHDAIPATAAGSGSATSAGFHAEEAVLSLGADFEETEGVINLEGQTHKHW